MKKHFINFIIFSSAVLITKVCYDFIMYLLPVVRSTKNAYFDVLLGMSLLVVLFLPLNNVIYSLSERSMQNYIKVSKKTMRQEIVAILLAYLLLLIVVFAILMKLKFGINVLAELSNLIRRKF